MGSMSAWMLISLILLGIVALIAVGLVVYWAMRLAMRHERRPQSSKE